jgi:hypothetical protein
LCVCFGGEGREEGREEGRKGREERDGRGERRERKERERGRRGKRKGDSLVCNHTISQSISHYLKTFIVVPLFIFRDCISLLWRRCCGSGRRL